MLLYGGQVNQKKSNDFRILPVELHHVYELNNLPPIHNDPFDRLLIAQSNAEALTLVSKDQKFLEYPVMVVW